MRPTLRHLLFGQTPFSPRSLFAAGEVGAWYEPGSLDTLYQTSTGTTPVTAGEQPVGLLLDKSKGLALGPEQLSASPSLAAWTFVNTNATIEGTAIKLTNTGTGFGYAFIPLSCPGGGTVAVAFAGRKAARARVAADVTPTAIFATFSGASAVPTTYVNVLGDTTPGLLVNTDNNTAGATFYIDYPLSFRELAGSHALQSSSTLRPTYKTSPSRLYFDADPDALTITFPSAPGNSTLAYGVSGGEPVITYPVNISGTTYTIDPSVIGTFGPELVTNGGFDSADGWTLGSTAPGVAPTITGGQMVFNSPNSSYTYARWALPSALTVGAVYKISIDVTAYTAGQFQIALSGNGSATLPTTTIASSGIKTYYFTATQPNTFVEISRYAAPSGAIASFDNFTIKQLTGAAAQNTGLVIVNRALTAAETVKLTQYLKARS